MFCFLQNRPAICGTGAEISLFRLLFLLASWWFWTPSLSSAQAVDPPSQVCRTQLISKIIRGETDEAKKLIESDKINLDARDCTGSSALIEAVVHDETATVRLLLESGASPTVSDNRNQTPLAIAAWYCREDAVQLLLGHGATLEARDIDGYSPLITSVQNCADGRLTALLLRSGARVDAKSKNGTTALTSAAFFGNEQAVYILIAAGADTEAKTTSGETALSIARDRRVGRKLAHDRIFSFLLRLADQRFELSSSISR